MNKKHSYTGGYIVKNNIFSKMIVFSFISIISLDAVNVLAQNPGSPSIIQLIAEGTPEQIQSMISGGANINEQNALGWTPLHAAVNFGKAEIVNILLANNANLNIQDSAGKTPLYMAVESGQKEMVQLLISKRPELNITANNGQNALSLAQTVGLSSIASALQQNGAAMPAPQNVLNPDSFVNNRRGRGGDPQNGQMPGNTGFRRGLGRGNLNPDLNPVPNPVTENPDQPVNSDIVAIQPEVMDVNNVTLDPNEVKGRLQKYDGLEKAVQTVANSSRIGMRQWLITEEDNRSRLITAERSQIEDELAFIKKIADEEKAKKTSEAVDKLLSSARERFLIAAREVRSSTDSQDKQSKSTTTSSRRSTRGTTSTTTSRSTRRGTTSAATGSSATSTTASATKPKETNYKPEVQSEVDTWMNANVTGTTGRLNLMNSIYDRTISELNSIKKIAAEEKAEKTIAAIDGLIVARHDRYDVARKELNKQAQQAPESMPNEMPVDFGIRGQAPDTTMPTPAPGARRGR
jgi:hypothetical protein